eukprot:CAMPEP_0169324520 /NCGR_PEP_ID=MMETSP1017-20121227/10516_1 /TAXON_ID=342587 /ORGANISM="Karlodinium micrum, Strain CCMP2283" /LENGTH=130 /DNA_ID=CAMNT_0009419173 /DNA_START=95 /DNA_END=485 /DNA_ORIENTATION=+
MAEAQKRGTYVEKATWESIGKIPPTSPTLKISGSRSLSESNLVVGTRATRGKQFGLQREFETAFTAHLDNSGAGSIHTLTGSAKIDRQNAQRTLYGRGTQRNLTGGWFKRYDGYELPEVPLLFYSREPDG